jgi:type VI secretion system Hcp family effector
MLSSLGFFCEFKCFFALNNFLQKFKNSAIVIALINDGEIQMAIYLKIPNVTGNVTTKNYNGWTEVDDLEFAGVEAHARMQVGQAIDRNASRPTFGQVTILKQQDKTSNTLFEAVHSGESIDELEFNYVSAGSTPITYGKLILKDVMVTHFSERHNSEAKSTPRELVRFAYNQIQRTFMPRTSDNKLSSASTTGYDIEKATKL